ncbi:MAG TPA: hypothetical protein V6C90_02860 [Coleofasciculaceae cyanobacterium]|jgi:hypothetical protein
MNSIETHSSKNWEISISQKEPDSFGYHCYGSNSQEGQNEGYDKTQDALEAAQNYIDEQTGVNTTVPPTREVGSPIEDDVSREDLNDL